MGKGWLGGWARTWAVGSWAVLKIHMQIDKRKKNELEIVRL